MNSRSSIALGIGLFTYHKYRKSIESTVPLDAHGNPIEDANASDSTRAHAYHELAETSRLTRGSRVSHDLDEVCCPRKCRKLPFPLTDIL
jgi:hypothetical protein